MPDSSEALNQLVMAQWARILQREPARLQASEHFFQAGGDSLQLIALLAALEQSTGRRLPLALVLRQPTLGRLMTLMAQARPAQHKPGIHQQATSVGGRRAFSAQEAAICFPERLSGRPLCQQAMIWRFRPGLCFLHVESVLLSLSQQEPALRMRRVLGRDEAGAMKEWLAMDRTPDLPWYSSRAPFTRFLHSPFMLDERLWRVRAVQRQGRVTELQFVFHHLIMDGQSGAWFGRECARRYVRILAGQPLTISRSARSQRAVPLYSFPSSDTGVASQRRYWQRRHRGWLALEDECLADPPIMLEKGGMRQQSCLSGRARQGWRRVRSMQWSARGLLPALERFLQQQRMPLFVLLLFAFTLWRACQAGQAHVLVGTMVANRMRSSAPYTLGCHTHLLALPQRLKPALSIQANLQQLAGRWRRDFSHQSLPFSQLVQGPEPPAALLVFHAQAESDRLEGVRVSAQRRFPRWGDPEAMLEVCHQGDRLCCLLHTPRVPGWRWWQQEQLKAYLALLTQVLLYPEQPLSSLLAAGNASSRQARTE